MRVQGAAFELPGARAFRPATSGANSLLQSAFVAGRLESGVGRGCANQLLRGAVRGKEPLTCISEPFGEPPRLARSMATTGVADGINHEQRLGETAPLSLVFMPH